jgi:hypothetical protein
LKQSLLISILVLGMLLVVKAGLARGEPPYSETQTQAAPPGWVIRTVDSGNVGQYASLALDSNGYAHVAYYDAQHAELRYAYQASLLGFTIWLTRTVDSASGVGQYASLALDPATDQPCIAYWLFGIWRGKATYGAPVRQTGDSPQGRGKGVGREL